MAKVTIPNPNKSTRKGQWHDEAVENDIGTEGLRETAKMFEAIRSLPLLLEKSEKEFQQIQETITQLEQKLSDKQEQVKMMTKTMENDRFLLEQNRKENQDLVKDKEKIETELINCKGRLSRYLGNKLTENNPGITDLSNENRPNKLGERFSELYDNQWTDAFEDLDKSNPNNEQANVEILLEILMDANTMCKEVSEKQHMDLRKMAYLKPVMEVETPTTPNDGSKVKDREDCKESENRDVKEAGSLETVLELNKQVKEFRRYTASLALGAVQGCIQSE